MDIKVESNIPIPKDRTDTMTALIRTMKPGDCITIPKSRRGGVASIARYLNIKTVSRTISGTEVRVWRTE